MSYTYIPTVFFFTEETEKNCFSNPLFSSSPSMSLDSPWAIATSVKNKKSIEKKNKVIFLILHRWFVNLIFFSILSFLSSVSCMMTYTTQRNKKWLCFININDMKLCQTVWRIYTYIYFIHLYLHLTLVIQIKSCMYICIVMLCSEVYWIYILCDVLSFTANSWQETDTIHFDSRDRKLCIYYIYIYTQHASYYSCVKTWHKFNVPSFFSSLSFIFSSIFIFILYSLSLWQRFNFIIHISFHHFSITK